MIENQLENLTPAELDERLTQNGKPTYTKRKVVIRVPKLKLPVKVNNPVASTIVNLEAIPEKWESEFLQKLQRRQKTLAHHLFVNVATLEAAIPVALEDAEDCLRMATDAEGVELSIGRVQTFIPKVVEISTLRFICAEMGLTASDTQCLVNDLLGKPNEELLKLQKLADMLRQQKVGDMGLREVRSKGTSQLGKTRAFDPDASRSKSSSGKRNT